MDRTHLVGYAPTRVEDRTHLVGYAPTRVEDKSHRVGYAPTRVEDSTHLDGYSPTRVEDRTHLVGYAPTRVEDSTHLVGYAPTRVEDQSHLVGYAPTRDEDSTHPAGTVSTGVEDRTHLVGTVPTGVGNPNKLKSMEEEVNTNFTTKRAFEDDDFISEKSGSKLEAIPEDMLRQKEEENSLPNCEHLRGETRTQIQTLLTEFRDLFRSVVSEQSAGVNPFSLRVDIKSWCQPKHCTRARRMSQTAEAEFRRQIDLLLELGVIRHSRAGYYSHGFMVPKPGGKMRLVVDFKNLNLVSEKESGWGIPNIKDILVRLGEQKSGYFCKLDLTAGFHQTPISEDSRIYTAFKTSWGGLYECIKRLTSVLPADNVHGSS